jgi:hypothetical protein
MNDELRMNNCRLSLLDKIASRRNGRADILEVAPAG